MPRPCSPGHRYQRPDRVGDPLQGTGLVSLNLSDRDYPDLDLGDFEMPSARSRPRSRSDPRSVHRPVVDSDGDMGRRGSSAVAAGTFAGLRHSAPASTATHSRKAPMLMRSPIPSMGCGAWAANMNARAPRTTDVKSDAIEYHRSQPWNAAAA